MSPAGRLDPDELAALEEQRDFLLRSLDDLDREHDAGDLDDDDHATLRDDYTARAAEVLRAIDDQRAAFAQARRPRSKGRTVAVAACIAVFAVVAGVTVAKAMGARKVGDSASGGVTVQQSPGQRANECIPEVGADPAGALECFQDVLDDDPQNAVALTWSAWQLSLVAPSLEGAERIRFQSLAAVRLDEAVESNPRYSYARAFRAVVAYRNGRFADAQRYLEEFEAADPSAQAAEVIEQMDLEANIVAALEGEGEGAASDPPADQGGSTPTTSVP